MFNAKVQGLYLTPIEVGDYITCFNTGRPCTIMCMAFRLSLETGKVFCMIRKAPICQMTLEEVKKLSERTGNIPTSTRKRREKLGAKMGPSNVR